LYKNNRFLPEPHIVLLVLKTGGLTNSKVDARKSRKYSGVSRYR
jgi:hypothetical protein